MQGRQSIDGVFIRTWGSLNREAQPVLLTHGVSGTSWDWIRPVMGLDTVDTLYAAIDLPGFGQSGPMGDEGYSLEALASRIYAVAAKLFQGRTYVHVAHSFSGKLAILQAGREGELLAGVALIDMGIEVGPASAKVQERVQTWPGNFPTLREAMEQYRSLFAKEPEDVFRLRMNEALRREDDGTVSIRRDPAFDREFLSVNREEEARLLSRSWERASVPLRIARAENSKMLTPETVAKMKEMQPAASIRTIAGSGHNVLSESPGSAVEDLRWATSKK